jgi:hypothetical protein
VQSGSYDFASEYSKPAPRTYAQKPAIRCAPRLDGDGNLTVSIESPDTSLRITYSLELKGSGPSQPGKTTPTSYARPIIVSGTALLSARTNASGCEPSFPALTYFDFDGRDSSGGDRPNLVIVHKAYGSSVQYAQPYSPDHPGQGPTSLVNGRSGWLDFEDPEWQGFEGIDMEAVVDLGKKISVTSVSAGFLSYQSVRVFLPMRVELFASTDGREYAPVASIERPLEKKPGVFIWRFAPDLRTTTCRFLKLVARNNGQCPDWHPAKGRKAWLFIDEIVVR